MGVVRVAEHSLAFVRDGDDVYHSYGANQGLVVGKEACLIVDSGFHNRTATELLKEARKHSPKRIYLLDTHYHSDHVFGSHPIYRAGATIIAHENCRQSMLRQSEKLLVKYKARNARLREMLRNVEVEYPTLTFKKNLTLNLGDETTVDIVHPVARAHTDGDSIAIVREDRVVYAGDIFWNKYHPNLEDASIKGQIQALNSIVNLRPKKVVPGHGQASTTAEVKTAANYLKELERNMRRTSRSPKQKSIIPSWAKGWKMKWLMDGYVASIKKPGS